MTLQEAKSLLLKVQKQEPLSAEEQSKIREAIQVINSSIFNVGVASE